VLPGIDIRERRVGDVRVLTAAGELDLFAAPELRERLLALMDAPGAAVVLDLRETTFLDSTALGVIVAAAKAGSASGARLVLVSTQPSIARTLAITGLDRVIAVERELEPALGLAERG
jgi:anti-sigma B factor antagonist